MPFDPASRYDPSSMGRVADDEIDPDAELFSAADDGEFGGRRYDVSVPDVSSYRDNAGGGGGGWSVGSGGEGFGLDLADLMYPNHRGGGARRRLTPKGVLCVLTVVAAVTALIAGTVKMASSKGVGVLPEESSSAGAGSAPPPVPSPTGDAGSGGDGGSGSGGSSSAPPKVEQFVPPPDDLSTKCAPLTVSTDDGWDACQALCASAECCFLPEGHWYSCAAEHGEDCSAYEYGCKTLDHVEILRGNKKPPPPSGGGGNVPSGAAEALVVVPPAPDDLADICSVENLAASSEGHSKCLDACDLAGCCDAANDVGCKVSNPEACDAYRTPCSVLTTKGATPSTHPDAASSQAMTKCNTQSLSTDEGVKECSDFCEPAKCCFETDIDETCAEDGEWCGQYGPCQGLLSLGGPGIGGTEDKAPFEDSDAAKAAVDDACRSGYSQCVAVCGPAECCFNNEGGSAQSPDCDSMGLGALECAHYDACAILFETTNISGGAPGEVERIRLAEAPSDLAELCAAADVEGDDADSEAADECEAACTDSSCCAKSDEVCVVDNVDACTDYEQVCQDRWNAMQ